MNYSLTILNPSEEPSIYTERVLFVSMKTSKGCISIRLLMMSMILGFKELPWLSVLSF